MYMALALSLLCLGSSSIFAQEASKPKIDIKIIESITGLKGNYNEKENVFKITQPRNDVKITVDNWSMPPFMGLTSWAAFSEGQKSNFMLMGDLVLFEDEVNSVISAAIEAGIDVTALHNHFFFDSPKVYFMHIAGEGNIEKLAKAVKACLDKIKQIRQVTAFPKKSFGHKQMPQNSTISAGDLETIFGQKGQVKDGMFKVIFGREISMECGCKVTSEMGVNTWAAFAGSDDNAVVDGDFAVLESELRIVIESLRKANINIVAIHHHMINEKPRMLFIHYWGRGTAADLAKAIKNALSKQAKI